MRCGVRGRWGDGTAQAACTGRARLKAGEVRTRAERTVNMPPLFVTLDMSKLTAWLNAYADCRVERRACDRMRCAARCGCSSGLGEA